MERGYTAVKLKDIAQSLGIRQASLYHHVPGGKEALFVEVLSRSMARHKAGLEQAVAEAGPDWIAQLRAVARWLLSQPPMDLNRMVASDVQALNEANREAIMRVSYEAVVLPVVHIFNRAVALGLARPTDPELTAGSFLSIIQGVHAIRDEWTARSREELADEMIDVMIYGLANR